MPPRLETERLVGQPATEDDWPLMLSILSDPRTGGWLRPGRVDSVDEADARRVARRFAENWASDGFGPYVWRLGARAIGYAGLRRSELEGQEELEALWGFTAEHHRRGYATEAMRAVVAADGPRPGDPRPVASWTTPENAASLAVMRKLDLRYVRPATYRGVKVLLHRGPKP